MDDAILSLTAASVFYKTEFSHKGENTAAYIGKRENLEKWAQKQTWAHRRLALGELEALAGAGQSVFFPFFFAGIPR